jgi:NTE family protein
MDHSLAFSWFDAITRIWSPYQFNPFDVNPLRDVLNTCIDFERLQRCNDVELFISTTNVRSGKGEVFRNPQLTIDVALASACLPFLFKAVEVNGKHYWDGGYMGNPALFPLFYYTKARDVLIVHLNPIERTGVPDQASEILNRINEISFNSSLLHELRAVAFVSKLIEEDWLKDEFKHKLKHVLVHSIRADQNLCDLSVVSKFNTDWDFLCDLRDRGRLAADYWLGDHYDSVGKRSSVHLRQDYLTNGKPI